MFFCTGLTDPKFRQTKIIKTMISYINIYFFAVYISCDLIFFFAQKNLKFSALGIVESWNKETWSILYVTCVDIIGQVSLTPCSIFLFLDVPILKLRIIIIILPTDWRKIILLTAHMTKN